MQAITLLQQVSEKSMESILEENSEFSPLLPVVEEEITSPAAVASTSITYSFQEEEFLACIYNTPAVDYIKLWYGDEKGRKHTGEEYCASTTATLSDTEMEMLSVEEAETTFKNIQYEAATHSIGMVNFDVKRKFDVWIKFNPALFKLFESLYAVTSDVNYAAPN